MSPERFGGSSPDVATVVGDAGNMRERMQLLEAFFAMVHSVKNLDELASDVIPRGIAANFPEPTATNLIDDSKIVRFLNSKSDISPEDIRASISLIKTVQIKSTLTKLFFPGSEHAHGTFVSEGGMNSLGIDDDDRNDFRTAVAAPTATRRSAPSAPLARPAAHPPTFVDDKPARFVPQRSDQPPQHPTVSQPPESKPQEGGLWNRIKKGLTGK